MAMPDAIDAMTRLALADKAKLSRTVYNIAAFSPTADEVAEVVRKAFPKAIIETKVDAKRQAIVDSWPAEIDDSAARRDWGHQPKWDFQKAFEEYLIPTIRKRYA